MEFNREPRLAVPPLAAGEVAVKAPPAVPDTTPANPVARLLPVVTVVAAVGMMAVYFTSGASVARSPMYMFFPVMMIMSVLGTVAYGARGSNRSAELDQNRRRYLRYLDGMEAGVRKAADDQRASLLWSHPQPRSLWVLAGGRRMWERLPDDPDFCHIRAGHGDRPLSTPLVAPEPQPDEEVDPVTTTALHSWAGQRSMVSDVPITLALRKFRVITVEGDASDARSLFRAMICQLAVLHGPEHVVIAAVTAAHLRDEWDWLKWLPHHQVPQVSDAAGSARRVYADLADAVGDATPPDSGARHAVVVLDGGSAVDGVPGGCTVFEVGASLDEAMAADRLRLRIDDDSLTVLCGESDIAGRPDALTRLQASVCARRLAPYRPAPNRGTGHSTPTAVAWPALMGIDTVEHLDPARTWTTVGDRRIASVPIGVSEHGLPVELDINEAARDGMGPHGLCVGATGSGKSEFLRTLTLGMIAAHPPEALNLVLVDFKGGATFLGLDRARHVSAVITNLADEAHLVARMHDALAGEMNRRQELLRAAGKFTNIADYERARTTGAAIPPLPALFIIVDEFSELLSQHPDFAELFVAIGRLGRSLGIHLLLASQRLDEGRLRGLDAHLSYRICLKTFSASDSRAVLGVPDAYHLPSTPGSAYLKSASGELVRFQTAYVSGPYRAQRIEPVGACDDSARPVVFTAAAVGAERAVPAHTSETAAGTLLDAVLDRVAGHGRPAHKVWLAPLTEPLTLDMVSAAEGRRAMRAPVGLVDKPYQQRHELLIVELAGSAGNVAVVGAPQSGKSTVLRTMILALAETHAPSDVQFYCLDFGGGTLFSLCDLPHMGAAAGRADGDLCRRVVAVMESVISAREARFRRLGIDSFADYRVRRAAGDSEVEDDPYGDVFLIVDGWSTLRQEFDGLEGAITAMAARGLSFGVHVVTTASRWAELRPALKDQMASRIELRLGDPAESEMDRRRARLLVDAPPGRGLTADGHEMVIALPRRDGKATADDLAEAVAADVMRLRSQWQDVGAPPVELLPLRISHQELLRRGCETTAMRIVIGMDERDLAPAAIDFGTQQHLLVLGESGCGKSALLRLLCQEILRTADANEAQIEIVDFRRTLLGVVESDHLAGYTASPSALVSRQRALLDRLEARMPGEDVTQQQLRTRSWWSGPEIFLVVDDYDLVASATGNPLAPLADFLPHATDLGLHVVVARRSGGAARAMFDPVLARMREMSCMGMMMSASPDEGVLLGTVRPTPLPPGRGTLITRGQPDQLIQVAWTDPP